MIDFSNLPLTPDSARAARNYCGLNQMQASDEANLPAHKIKRFEAGNYIPDTKFMEDLRAFYEGLGYEFPNAVKPGTKAKATGKVFPSGVVQTTEEDEASEIGKPQKHMVQHIRIDPNLSDDEIGNIFDHIERNEEKVESVLRNKVETSFLGGLSDLSEANHGKALRLLAENGTLFAKLLGRPLVSAPTESLAKGNESPKNHGDLLAKTQADMHAAVLGDKEAIARHKVARNPQSLSNAVFA